MDRKHVFYIFCFIVFLYPLQVSAASEETPATRRVFLFDKDASIESDEDLPIYAFFSHVKIHGKTGPIFSFFSTIEGQDTASYSSFSSVIQIDTSKKNTDISYQSYVNIFFDTYEADGKLILNDKIPSLLILLVFVVSNVFIGMSFYALKPSFLEQGAMLLVEEPHKVLKNGLSAYFLGATIIIILAIGVILLPLGLFFLLMIYIISAIGEVSLGVLLGYQIAYYYQKPSNAATYAFIGLLSISIIKNLPIIGWILGWIILPIITIGITTTNIINGGMKKKFYPTPFTSNKNELEKNFHREEIRDTILGSSNKIDQKPKDTLEKEEISCP